MPAGLDVPVVRGDEPARRELGLDLAQLPAQRLHRVLHRQGGGAAQERHGHRDRRGAVVVMAGVTGNDVPIAAAP